MNLKATGQDPNFGQFFSSPLNINPALTGNINADWRIISNFRTQWIQPANPYLTGTICYDRKLFQKKYANMEEGNRFSMGGMLMYDVAMAGIAKNSYASLHMSYNAKMSEGDVINRVGAGFGATYGRKYVDFEKLNFEEQFIGNGFDVSLPTGEAALSNLKAYTSLSGGLLYSRTTEKSNIDFGISAFHVNKPKQTFLEDDRQVIAMRKVVHANVELFLNDYMVLNTNATYQRQSTAYYYSFGGGVGYMVSNMPDIVFNAGLWYWSNNCFTPYLGFQRDNFQIGLSYDATISKLRIAPRQTNSFELSLILRGTKSESRTIPCPWK
jgi:type IX secretion system PorP/SprF family membrane protein